MWECIQYISQRRNLKPRTNERGKGTVWRCFLGPLYGTKKGTHFWFIDPNLETQCLRKLLTVVGILHFRTMFVRENRSVQANLKGWRDEQISGGKRFCDSCWWMIIDLYMEMSRQLFCYAKFGRDIETVEELSIDFIHRIGNPSASGVTHI